MGLFGSAREEREVAGTTKMSQLRPPSCPAGEDSTKSDQSHRVPTYQGGGIGAVEAEQGDRRLDGLGRGRGRCEESGLRGEHPRGSRGTGRAEDLSRQHGGWSGYSEGRKMGRRGFRQLRASLVLQGRMGRIRQMGQWLPEAEKVSERRLCPAQL